MIKKNRKRNPLLSKSLEKILINILQQVEKCRHFCRAINLLKNYSHTKNMKPYSGGIKTFISLMCLVLRNNRTTVFLFKPLGKNSFTFFIAFKRLFKLYLYKVVFQFTIQFV